jgi:hypothetical protein
MPVQFTRDYLMIIFNNVLLTIKEFALTLYLEYIYSFVLKESESSPESKYSRNERTLQSNEQFL